MIPENSMSPILITDHFIEPDDIENYLLLDFEAGGSALNYPGDGLFYQTWTFRYYPETGNCVASAPNTPETVLFNLFGIVRMSCTFDQNMNPFVAYVKDDGTPGYWWWDPVPADTVFATLPAGSLTPVCCLDDKRSGQTANSDVILCYILNGEFYYRQQRDRFTVQYQPANVPSPFLHPVYDLPAVLKRVGMNKKNRLQWLCDLANPIDWCNYKAEA